MNAIAGIPFSFMRVILTEISLLISFFGGKKTPPTFYEVLHTLPLRVARLRFFLIYEEWLR